MRQTYYGIAADNFVDLQGELERYSMLAKQLVAPFIDSENRLELLKERNHLKAVIQSRLTAQGAVLGFLNDEQIDELETGLQAMKNKDAQAILRTNGIPDHRLEQAISALMSLESKGAVASVMFYLERARQQRQNVIVWIS